WGSLDACPSPPLPESSLASDGAGLTAFCSLGTKTNAVVAYASRGMTITVTIRGSQALNPPAAVPMCATPLAAPPPASFFAGSPPALEGSAIIRSVKLAFQVNHVLQHFVAGRDDLSVRLE